MMSKQSSAPPTARRYRPGSSAKSALAKARCALKRDNERDAMRRALELAWRGWGRVSPNPLVGAVVLRRDEAIAESWHAGFGGPDAEGTALPPARHQTRRSPPLATPQPPAPQ